MANRQNLNVFLKNIENSFIQKTTKLKNMILLIDNYDSFVFNVEQYLKEFSDEDILTVRNDKITLEQIKRFKPSRIVFSPGPKHPRDSGICLQILREYSEQKIPILGICLGHQAIGHVFGAKISQLAIPLHGKMSLTRQVDKNGSPLLQELPACFNVMRYHSLHVEDLPQCLRATAFSSDKVVMALEHVSLPIYGIQFHPESFFSDYGKKIIENFVALDSPSSKEALQAWQEKNKIHNKNLNRINSKETNMLRRHLTKLQENIPLDHSDFNHICEIISRKKYDEVQLGSLLVLISEKSLYPESLEAFVKNILKYSTTFSDPRPMLDVCGTGGDGFKSINISTAVSFILAALGVTVAKHGNKAVSSKSGSSDVLTQMQIPMSDSLSKQQALLQEKNLAFFHAPFFHQLVGEVKEVRARLGIRTVFNVLGPLLHPNTSLKYQLVGLYHAPVQRLYAETLALLGREHALVVRGEDGMDEVSICDKSKIIELKNGQILEYSITPEMFGFQRAFPSEIEGGTPAENSLILENILNGKEKGAKRDIVVLNAMFALYTAEAVDHPAKAKAMVEEAIDNQKVWQFLKAYTE